GEGGRRRGNERNGRWIAGCCAAALLALSSAAQAGTLDRLKQDGTIRIAYRLDAPPFSFQDKEAKPAGFIVDLCQSVAKQLSEQMNLPSLKVSYVAGTATGRFDSVKDGKAGLRCEATTVTMSRRRIMDFSVDTFVDGASLITTVDGPKDLKEMAGKSIGVLAGTTTEQALRNTLSSAGVTANVTPASSHATGLGMLDS